MKRSDFRPSNFSSSISDKDRQTIGNHKKTKEMIEYDNKYPIKPYNENGEKYVGSEYNIIENKPVKYDRKKGKYIPDKNKKSIKQVERIDTYR